MPRLPVGTYRITLTHEQSGTKTWEMAGLDAARVEQVMGLLMQAAPYIKAAQGAKQAWDGIERALSGLAELGAPPAPRRRVGRGRR